MNKQRGFTLIELVVVIVILGILAAVALPKFTNLQKDARIAKLNGARGAVQAAAAMVHGSALARANGQPFTTGGCTGTATAAGGGTLCTEQGLVTLINFYPTANAAGIGHAAGLSSQSLAGLALGPANVILNTQGFNLAGGGAAIGSTLTFQVTGGTVAANCSFTYTPSTGGAAGSGPTISAATTTGC